MKEVAIGQQIWMNENLNVDIFRNGDKIEEARTIEEWNQGSNEEKPMWCYYDNNPDNGPKYGKLYNWYAVNDPRGLAPLGWHIPSHLEWEQLSVFLGGHDISAMKLKNNNGWAFNQYSGNGTNETGFSALPGGYLINLSGWMFENRGRYGCWWTSTEKKDATNWLGFSIRPVAYTVGMDTIKFWGGINNKLIKGHHYLESGYSVRCIKNT
jgi:uncharacterized protein (TIGR02145 family)